MAMTPPLLTIEKTRPTNKILSKNDSFFEPKGTFYNDLESHSSSTLGHSGVLQD